MSAAHTRQLHTHVSCTHTSAAHTRQLHTHVSCTHMSAAHTCQPPTHVSRLHMSAAHKCQPRTHVSSMCRDQLFLPSRRLYYKDFLPICLAFYYFNLERWPRPWWPQRNVSGSDFRQTIQQRQAHRLVLCFLAEQI